MHTCPVLTLKHNSSWNQTERCLKKSSKSLKCVKGTYSRFLLLIGTCMPVRKRLHKLIMGGVQDISLLIKEAWMRLKFFFPASKRHNLITVSCKSMIFLKLYLSCNHICWMIWNERNLAGVKYIIIQYSYTQFPRPLDQQPTIPSTHIIVDPRQSHSGHFKALFDISCLIIVKSDLVTSAEGSPLTESQWLVSLNPQLQSNHNIGLLEIAWLHKALPSTSAA